MLNFLINLVFTSIIGVLAWVILQFFTSVLNQKLSQSTQYYIRLIPISILLGLNIVIAKMVLLIFQHKSDLLANQPSAALVQLVNGDNKEYLLNIRLDYEGIGVAIFLIWVMGVVIFLSIQILTYYKFRHKMLLTAVDLEKDVFEIPIMKSSYVPTPFLIGIISPIIIIPNLDFNEKELNLILSHELVHYRRKDILIKWLVLVANGIHWFNPLMYKINRELDIYCETSCDEIVIKEMSKAERIIYGATIISLVEHGMMTYVDMAKGLCHTKKIIKKRVDLIMSNSFKQSRSIFFILGFAMLCTGVSTAYAFEQSDLINLIKQEDEKSREYSMETLNGDKNSIVDDEKSLEGFEWVKGAEDTTGRVNPDPVVLDGTIEVVYPEEEIPEFEWMKDAEDTTGRINPDPVTGDSNIPIIYPEE